MGKEIQGWREGNGDLTRKRNTSYLVWKNSILKSGCLGCCFKSNRDLGGKGGVEVPVQKMVS